MRRLLIACYCATCAILLLPLTISPHLRSAYAFTVNHWLAKARQLEWAIVGDSMAAGLGNGLFGGSINVASNGLTIAQITALAKTANDRYRPRTLVVLAGTNDVLAERYRAEETKADLTRMLSVLSDLGPRVILTLIPPTRDAAINARIRELNAMLAPLARSRGIVVVDLDATLAPAGVLLERFTTDGVHFSDAGNAEWWQRLADAAHGDMKR